MTPFKNPDNTKYKMIDLFAGIGGIRLGLQLTNEVSTVFSSEWDKFAQQTYEANFGEVPAGDITQIEADDIPDHDILVGGFPCQAFSQAGKQLGFEDTRGTLFFEIARIIKAKRPKVFLLENVKNLVRHDKGKTFKVIMDTLTSLDYVVGAKVLNGKDFGVPQNRERIYIVGFDKHQVNNIEDFRFPTPPMTSTQVGNVLDVNVPDKYTISDRLWAGHKRRKSEHIQKGNGFGYSMVNNLNSHTNTLSARYGKDGSEILIEQNGKNPRKLTPKRSK